MPAKLKPVDWTETESLDEILHCETIETQYLDAEGSSRLTVVLGRKASVLLIFKHRIEPDEETMTRMNLPEPLNAECAAIETHDMVVEYSLHLEPENSKAIRCRSSTRISGKKKWETELLKGGPVYETVESKDEAKLNALRVLLIGKAAAGKCTASDQLMRDAAAQFETLSPEQQQAGAFAMLQQMVDLNPEEFDFPEPDPAADSMEQNPAFAAVLAKAKAMDDERKAIMAKYADDPAVKAYGETMKKIMKEK